MFRRLSGSSVQRTMYRPRRNPNPILDRWEHELLLKVMERKVKSAKASNNLQQAGFRNWNTGGAGKQRHRAPASLPSSTRASIPSSTSSNPIVVASSRQPLAEKQGPLIELEGKRLLTKQQKPVLLINSENSSENGFLDSESYDDGSWGSGSQELLAKLETKAPYLSILSSQYTAIPRVGRQSSTEAALKSKEKRRGRGVFGARLRDRSIPPLSSEVLRKREAGWASTWKSEISPLQSPRASDTSKTNLTRSSAGPRGLPAINNTNFNEALATLELQE